MPPAQVALSWIADRPSVVAPIVGARTVEHLRSNLGAADLILDKDATEALEKVSRPQLWRLSLWTLRPMAAWTRAIGRERCSSVPGRRLHEYPGKENQPMTTGMLDLERASVSLGSVLRDGAVRLRVDRLRVHVGQPAQQIVPSSRRMIPYSMSAHRSARHESSE